MEPSSNSPTRTELLYAASHEVGFIVVSAAESYSRITDPAERLRWTSGWLDPNSGLLPQLVRALADGFVEAAKEEAARKGQ
jgi:hypothetical protein